MRPGEIQHQPFDLATTRDNLMAEIRAGKIVPEPDDFTALGHFSDEEAQSLVLALTSKDAVLELAALDELTIRGFFDLYEEDDHMARMLSWLN